MDEIKFIKKREFLYHLTDTRNLNLIIESKSIHSTWKILAWSDLSEQERNKYFETRRPDHIVVNINGNKIYIRDQRPISLIALGKCLTDNWSVEDFLKHLNSRVFFWPTLNRLEVHYDRYRSENPTILRFKTSELLELNSHAEYSHINSGATRPNYYLNGLASSRGKNTFKPAKEFEYNVGKVAEVTFPDSCKLPYTFCISSNPNGPWKAKTL